MNLGTGNPTLSWIHRLRISVPKACREKKLIQNPILRLWRLM